jgi:hypothetical protein
MKMVPVSEAAKQSGYTRQHVHNLANQSLIKSQFLTETFRLVDVDGLLKYAKEQGKTAEVVAND